MKRVQLSFLIFLFFFSTIAFGSGEIFLKGMEAFVGENYPQSVDSFSQVIHMKGDFIPDAYYYKILSLMKMGTFSAAWKVQEEFQQIGYESALLYLEWGKIYMNLMGHWDQPDLRMAKEMLERAKELKISTHELYGLLGSVNYNLGDLETSLYYYQKAVSQNPGESSYHSSLARTYLDLEQIDRAIYHLEWSLDLLPRQSGLLVILAQIYFDRGKILDFKRYYREAIHLDPNRFSLRQEYGIRLYQLGFLEEALLQLEEAVRISPKNYLPHYYLGVIHWERGAIDRAMDSFQETLHHNPNYTDALLAMGDLLMMETPYRALSLYYQAMEMSPHYAPVYLRLAKAYHAMGFHQSTVDNLRRALQLNPAYDEAKELLEQL